MVFDTWQTPGWVKRLRTTSGGRLDRSKTAKFFRIPKPSAVIFRLPRKIISHRRSTGKLPYPLRQPANASVKGKAIRGHVTDALVYPAFGTVAAIAAGVVLPLPAIIGLPTESGGGLPLATWPPVEATS